MLSSNPNKTRRVLIADDDPVIRHWLTSFLQSEGYDVVSMCDGREAYRVLQSDANFKGAVFDMSMPNLDGPDLVRHMRTEKRLMRIPVMMITAESDIRVLAQGFASGATFMLPKPFTKVRLQQTVRMMLGSAPTQQNDSQPDHNQPISATGKSLPGWSFANKTASHSTSVNSTTVAAKQSVDLQVLRSLVDCDDEEDWGLITELIDLYLESGERELHAIKAAALEGDQRSIRQRCHKLRGSSSTIGAWAIAKICEQLEEADEQNAPRVDKLVGELESEFASTRKVLVAEREETSQLVAV